MWINDVLQFADYIENIFNVLQQMFKLLDDRVLNLSRGIFEVKW